MIIMAKTKELKEEDLKKISGGIGNSVAKYYCVDCGNVETGAGLRKCKKCGGKMKLQSL